MHHPAVFSESFIFFRTSPPAGIVQAIRSAGFGWPASPRSRAVRTGGWGGGRRGPRAGLGLVGDGWLWMAFGCPTRPGEQARATDEPAAIGARAGWADRPGERGCAFRGHRLL